MSHLESEHGSGAFKKHSVAVFSALGAGCAAFFMWNSVVDASVSALIVFAAFEVSTYFRGVRTLSLSHRGILLESSHGQKMLRIAWSDLTGAEVASIHAGGPTWTFFTKAGASIQWHQAGLKGDRRQILGNALIQALRDHRIRIS
jgi:hypothetical protein